MIEEILNEINSIEDLWERRSKCYDVYYKEKPKGNKVLLNKLSLLIDKITNEIVDFETEQKFLLFLEEGFDSFQEEYLNERSSKEIYIDQAPSNSVFFDRQISSAYTPYGIRNLDSWMCRQIQDGSKYDKATLEKMIRCCYHFHNVIKTNLIYNLRNYKRHDHN